jgi:DNA-binding LacI/PurR family transcriptional regulator
MTQKKPTLVSLAESIGVSRQTVSNVLNAPQRVKPATRERVLKAVRESGYRPSAAARQLRTRRSMDLGLRLTPVTDGINGAVQDRFLHALTEAAQDAGYRLTLYSARDDEEEIRHIDELLHVADLDGFVLTGTHAGDPRTAWLQEHAVPFAAFGRPWSRTEDPFASAHPWVDIDGAAGTESATGFLLDQGHRRIGFLGWRPDEGLGDDRRAGWHRAMEAAGLGGSLPELSAVTDDDVAAGASAVDGLLAKGVTALVCASDSLALGAFAQLRAVLPPEQEPAVVGFDDTPVAAAVGLSSVAPPVADAARRIIAVLSHVLAGRPADEGPQRHQVLRPSLVVRTPHALGRIARRPPGS